MKRIISTLSFLAVLFSVTNVSSQVCTGGHGPSVCSPDGSISGGGFENPNSTTCAVQGTAYSEAIQFNMFSVFSFQGLTVDVDSIRFNTISNLPCGLCWAVNQADQTYSAGEDGCISITGTTTDSAGQYKLSVTLTAWISGQTNGQQIPATLVEQAGVKMLIRVKAPTGVCVTADTSASANNLTANPANCPTGVNDLGVNVSSVTMTPNPMNMGMALSFTSVQSEIYTMSISDITGKIISSEEVEAKTGINTVFVERNNLSTGVYFLSLGNGKSSVTQRFSVTD